LAKKKKSFSKVISLLAIVFGICMPTLAYCLSHGTQDYFSSSNHVTLVIKPTTDYLVPHNLCDLLADHIQKDKVTITKALWTAYVLYSHIQVTCSNVQLKATENNLEPPEHLKSFLIFHSLNRHSDFFL
jgi:hypothetical protein